MKKAFCFLVLLLMLSVPSVVYAGADSVAPVITKVTFDPAIASAGDTVSITIDLVEDGTGVDHISMQLIDINTGEWLFPWITPDDASRHTGKHTFSYTIPEDTVAGEYRLRVVDTIDLNGNEALIDDYEGLGSEASIVVQSDYVRPSGNENRYEANYIQLLDNEVYKGDKIKVRLSVTYNSHPLTSNDPMPGVSITVGYVNHIPVVDLSLESDGIITGYLPIDNYTRKGTWPIWVLSIEGSDTTSTYGGEDSMEIYQDENGQYLLGWYTDYDISPKKCYVKGSNLLTIKNVPGVDYDPPVLKKVEITDSTVFKPGIVRVKVQAEDDAGISGISISLQRCREGFPQQSDNAGVNAIVSGDRTFDDYVDVPVAMNNVEGVYRVSSIGLVDINGNSACYSYDPSYHDEKGWYYWSEDNNCYVEQIPTIQVKEEFDIDFETSLSNPKLYKKVLSMEDGKTARVLINSNKTAKEELFRAIQGTNKTLIFYYGNYQWVFNGQEITAPKDVLLDVSFERIDSEEYGVNDPLLKVIFPDNGVLPGRANVRIKSDYTYQLYQLTGSVYLYHVKDDGSLSLENQSNPVCILDDTDHWCYFDLTHNSSFVLSGKKLGKNVVIREQKKKNGSEFKKIEEAIKSMKSDTDPKGSIYSKLKLRSSKQTSKSITLNWNKTGKAVKYVIYGNKCGKKYKPKKIAAVKGNTKKLTKVAGKRLKKGTYYKFIIVALDKDNNVVSTSKLIHVATKGGKVGNYKSVTVKKAVINKARKLRKGKTLKLNAKAVAQSKKLPVKKHVGLRYESSNKKIATVTSKGVIKGKKKGTCYIYAYAQNGVFKKIKVTVK